MRLRPIVRLFRARKDRPAVAPPRRELRGLRPRLEDLEGRIAPAVFTLGTVADVVNAGDGVLSLREAITLANANPDADTINIPRSFLIQGTGNFAITNDAVIKLNGTQLPTITTPITITGDVGEDTLGARLRVSGEGLSRVFAVGPAGNLTLRAMNVENGVSGGYGGGIDCLGPLTLDGVAVVNCSAGLGGGGVSVRALTDVVVRNSNISGNSAPEGGGLWSVGGATGTLTISGSTFAQNRATVRGGGLYTETATVTITDSTIRQNVVQGVNRGSDAPSATPLAGGNARGGGVMIAGGSVSILRSTIELNEARGGSGGRGVDGAGYGATGDAGNEGGLYSIPRAGQSGSNAASGAAGGVGLGGGLFHAGAGLVVRDSTLSDNVARGGTGGAGGTGGNGQNGGKSIGGLFDSFTLSLSEIRMIGDGGDAGDGGDGGAGGAGGRGSGGGLHLSDLGSGVSILNSTIAQNRTEGGQGGRGGTGGVGGTGGDAARVFTSSTSGNATYSGQGGDGGDGGDGGATGSPGASEGGGIYFNDHAEARVFTNVTIAYNNAVRGPDAEPRVPGISTSAAGFEGSGGNAGTSVQGTPPGATGTAGKPGVLAATVPASGGGVWGSTSGKFDAAFRNSIIASNRVDSATASNITGKLAHSIDSSYNLVGPGGNGGMIGLNQLDVVGTYLLPLANYGGPTKTVAFYSGSPARGYGNDAISSRVGLTTDQRGQPRLFNRLDLGAYEWNTTDVQPDLVVTTLKDEDNGTTDPSLGSGTSLREAIILSNQSPVPQTIRFQANLTGTLVTPQLTIQNNSVSIVGPGADKVSISGGGGGRVLSITTNVPSVSISGLTFRDCFANGNAGGAIFTFGKDLILDSVVFTNNKTNEGNSTYSGAGAIYAYYSLTVKNSVFSNNSALASGGAIYARNLTVENSTFTGNTSTLAGGAVYTMAGLSVKNSTFTNNDSGGGSGGAILAKGGASVVNSTFSNNINRAVGGAIHFQGGATVESSTFLNNRALTGGAIVAFNVNVTVRNSSFVSNSATATSVSQGGGAIYHSGSLSAINSLFDSNTSQGVGGAIRTDYGSLTLVNTTIARNSAAVAGGAIYNSSPVTLQNVTVAGNSAPSAPGLYVSGATFRNSIVADASDLFGTTTLQGGNIINSASLPGNTFVDPKLGPLQDNGGAFPTMALLPGSPAIDAGDNAFATDPAGQPLTGDLRGFKRVSNGRVDLGAYEVQRVVISPATITAGLLATTPYPAVTFTASQDGIQPAWGALSTPKITEGTLPPGLNLSPAGVLSGTPNTPGVYTFTVSSGNLGGIGTRTYTIKVGAVVAPMVDNLGDEIDYDFSAGQLTLREALLLAGLTTNVRTVTFSPGLQGTITPATTLPLVAGVTLNGPGASKLTVTGSGTTQVFTVQGNATIRDLTVANSKDNGIRSLAHLTLERVVVRDTAGVGVAVSGGNLTVVDSTITRSSAGGIYTIGAGVRVVNSTISYNTATRGAGIRSEGTADVSVVNSTIAFNTATERGGGIDVAVLDDVNFLFGSFTFFNLSNSTIYGNTAPEGGGFYYGLGTYLVMGNSIIAGDGEQFGFAPEWGFANVLEMPGPMLIQGGALGLPVIDADPKLGPLQDNGGPTATMALLAGSPAVDAGENAAAALSTDQRGAGFARISGARVDLGATEQRLNSPTVAATSASVSAFTGESVSNTGTFDDPDGRITVRLTASSGTVTRDVATGTWSWTDAAGAAPNQRTVTITATDDSGLKSTVTFNVVVTQLVATTPTVTGVTSPTADGAYRDGNAIVLKLAFSEPVSVTGTPRILLNTGGFAVYTAGSGTNELTFTYNIVKGENSSDLDYDGASALQLNGGSISAVARGNTAAATALPTPGLAASRQIAVDTVAPTVLEYRVLYGSRSFNVIGSTRTTLPWAITGIRAVFSKPVASASLASLQGVSATGLTGLGTNTLTWTFGAIDNGTLLTSLVGFGPNAVTDAAGNLLADGLGFGSTLQVLQGDFNGDGLITTADVSLTLTASRAAYNAFADYNGDGIVNALDIAIARNRIGNVLSL